MNKGLYGPRHAEGPKRAEANTASVHKEIDSRNPKP